METIWTTFLNAFQGYAQNLWHEVTHPSFKSFFWWTIGLSLFFFLMEIIKPWREKQPVLRKDFWLDLFYVFFNFFIFSLIGWYAGTQVVTDLFESGLNAIGYTNVVAKSIAGWPIWAYYLLLFLVGDFISWSVHRMLHKVSWMWEFHKVHHSVEEMGFAAHVRYHWMENVIYWTVRFIPLSLLGYNVVDLFALHVLNVAWGHFNHMNVTVSPRLSGAIFGGLLGLGLATVFGMEWMMMAVMTGGGLALGVLALGPFMRYIFNSPEMHIWHHAYEMPADKPNGINFGITLAIWDYIFGTARMPSSGRDIRLGFPGIENFPKTFVGQLVYGFGKKK